MLIAKVVPQIRLPRGFIFFDYLIPEKIVSLVRLGSLVKVPFRNRQIYGIIFDISELSTIPKVRLKPIIDVYDQEIFLPRKLLETIKWLSDELFLPPSTIIQATIPDIPKNFRKAQKIRLPAQIDSLKIPRQSVGRLINIFKKLSDFDLNPQTKTILSQYHYDFEKYCLIYKLVEKIIKEKKNVILITPYINDVVRWQNLLSPLVDGRIGLLHGELNKSQLWQEWKGIKLKKVPIVIGTRQAIFAPFDNVDRIIIDKAESDDFKQSDQNPRYDARLVAVKRAHLDHAKIYNFSQVPRLEDYYWCEKPSREKTCIDIEDFGNISAPIKLIDLKNTIKSFTPLLSDEVLDGLKTILEKKQKTFILINQRGFAGSLICQDCGHSIDCPNCQLPLVCHQDSLLCHHCQATQLIPIICQNCNGSNLKPIGYGTERIKEILKKHFPKAIIDRVDSDHPILNPAANIIIGTTLFINRYLNGLESLGLIIVASIDNLLFLPDFNSGEKAMQILFSLSHFSKAKKIPLYIQSYNPKNPILNAAVADDYQAYYHSQIIERKALGYPPISRLVKLIIQMDKREKTFKKAANLAAELKKISANLVEVLGPMPTNKRGRSFKSSIIVKYKAEKRFIIDKMFSQLDPEVIIDVDPISLL